MSKLPPDKARDIDMLRKAAVDMVQSLTTNKAGRDVLTRTIERLADVARDTGKSVGGPELHGLDTETHVFFYEHDFYPLSNFSAFSIRIWGERFDTSEAAYHWAKFPKDPFIQRDIVTAPSAHEAFKIAEKNREHRRPDWDKAKVDTMREILRAKLSQHEYVRRKLLATGDRILVEDSWRDDFWGWGPKRDGQNQLGKLWMELRRELKNSSP